MEKKEVLKLTVAELYPLVSEYKTREKDESKALEKLKYLLKDHVDMEVLESVVHSIYK